MTSDGECEGGVHAPRIACLTMRNRISSRTSSAMQLRSGHVRIGASWQHCHEGAPATLTKQNTSRSELATTAMLR